MTTFIYIDGEGNSHELEKMDMQQLRECVIEMAEHIHELEQRNVTIITEIFAAANARSFH